MVNEPLLRLMKRAGCRLIHYGVETGNDRIAQLTRKRISAEQQREGILLTKRAGIETLCFFLLGYPSETKAEMLETIRFAQKLNPSYASFHRIAPYHGTALYEDLDGGDVDLFPTFAGKTADKETVDRLVRKAFWQFYVRPRYAVSRLLRASPVSLWRQLRLFAGYIR